MENEADTLRHIWDKRAKDIGTVLTDQERLLFEEAFEAMDALLGKARSCPIEADEWSLMGAQLRRKLLPLGAGAAHNKKDFDALDDHARTILHFGLDQYSSITVVGKEIAKDVRDGLEYLIDVVNYNADLQSELRKYRHKLMELFVLRRSVLVCGTKLRKSYNKLRKAMWENSDPYRPEI